MDPFLDSEVKPGTWFWMLLYPRTITSLRHEWEHPAFSSPTPPAKDPAEDWLRDYADSLGIDFDKLIEYGRYNATRPERSQWPDYLVDGGTLEGISTHPKFWDQLAIYLDIEIPTRNRENFFSCSC